MAPCLFEIGQSVFYTPDQLHPNALASGTYVARAVAVLYLPLALGAFALSAQPAWPADVAPKANFGAHCEHGPFDWFIARDGWTVITGDLARKYMDTAYTGQSPDAARVDALAWSDAGDGMVWLFGGYEGCAVIKDKFPAEWHRSYMEKAFGPPM